MARLRIVRIAPGASVQDRGRTGYRRYGVSVSGPMDWARHELALRLAGCAPDAPCIEFGPGGATVEALDESVLVAATGPGFRLEVKRPDGHRSGIDTPATVVLQEGATLSVTAKGSGTWGYAAWRGAEFGDATLGSRATNLRTRLGPAVPHDGTVYGAEPTGSREPPTRYADPVEDTARPIALLHGPQTHLFTDTALERLVEEAFHVTRAIDRMGYRLEGPRLEAAAGHDIVSDALTEGAIQVPGDGQPIVLCADRAPTGGYPKIAVVARADLPRLVQSLPGAELRFAWTTVEAARSATTALRAELAKPEPLARTTLDPTFLLTRNLIDGVWGVEPG